MSGTWASSWVTGDVVTAAEFRKSMGCVRTSTLGVAAASFDLTGLPTSYAHMRIECYLRGDTAATSVPWLVRFNADSGANYDYQGFSGNTASATVAETFARRRSGREPSPAASAPASVFGLLIIELSNYGNTAGNKVAYFTTADKRGTASGSLVVRADAGFWRSSAAISRVTVSAVCGQLGRFGSRASVYVMGS
jgi:hypothetical protein